MQTTLADVLVTHIDALASQLAHVPNAIAEPNPDQAFALALRSAAPAIFVAGSLYLAGAAIAFFDKIAE